MPVDPGVLNPLYDAILVNSVPLSDTKVRGMPCSAIKPVQMIADAIRDVSGRGDVVLDIFGGSGSTLIAAEKTGRRGYLCELDPVYCDRILARWESYAKDEAEQLVCGWQPPAAHSLEAAE